MAICHWVKEKIWLFAIDDSYPGRSFAPVLFFLFPLASSHNERKTADFRNSSKDEDLSISRNTKVFPINLRQIISILLTEAVNFPSTFSDQKFSLSTSAFKAKKSGPEAALKSYS